jgi:hypothetical protein
MWKCSALKFTLDSSPAYSHTNTPLTDIAHEYLVPKRDLHVALQHGDQHN